MNNWSRILDSRIADLAKTEYDDNPDRRYHNWAHILRLYWHAAETFHLPYDPDLDLAILTHDVIYDAADDKEKRSVAWLQEHAAGPTAGAEYHILRTIEHRPTADDNRMILLDLADFLCPDRTGPNLDNIGAESMALYGITMPEFLHANMAVMKTLAERIEESMSEAPSADQQHFHGILSGIVRSIVAANDRLHFGN